MLKLTGLPHVLVTAVLMTAVRGEVVFTESFETPDVTGIENTADPAGWISCVHPSYLKLVDTDSGVFTTPDGTQGLSCYTSLDKPGKEFSGVANAMTTRELLDLKLQMDVAYVLSFRVAAYKGKKAYYMAELVAVDDREGTISPLAMKSGINSQSNDMSHEDKLIFTPGPKHAEYLGQRIAIRLSMDPDFAEKGGEYFDKPIFDQLSLDLTTAAAAELLQKDDQGTLTEDLPKERNIREYQAGQTETVNAVKKDTHPQSRINKPTDNKPTDNKPTDNKPTDNKPGTNNAQLLGRGETVLIWEDFEQGMTAWSTSGAAELYRHDGSGENQARTGKGAAMLKDSDEVTAITLNKPLLLTSIGAGELMVTFDYKWMNFGQEDKAFRIEFSPDNGTTWKKVRADYTSDNQSGSAFVSISSSLTDQSLIRFVREQKSGDDYHAYLDNVSISAKR